MKTLKMALGIHVRKIAPSYETVRRLENDFPEITLLQTGLFLFPIVCERDPHSMEILKQENDSTKDTPDELHPCMASFTWKHFVERWKA
jgi:hypothetical protein